MHLTTELKALLDELHRRMGRNLMTYQAIENALKMLLPHKTTTERPATGVLELNGKLPTLGNLVRAYVDRVDARWEGCEDAETDVLDFVLAPISKVVKSRNRLVHTFLRAPGVDTYTRSGLEEGIRLLDEEYQEAQEVYDHFVPMLLILMSALRARDSERADLALLEAVLAEHVKQRGLSVFFHKADYSRVIALLKEAEAKATKVDGLTHLSWAGNYIRQAEPDFKPDQLGENNLVSVLLATGMFEVFKRQREGATTYQLLYRSLSPPIGTEYHLFPT